MSGKFSGFTDDDIKKVQNLPVNKRSDSVQQKLPIKSKKKVVIRVDEARHKVLESKSASNEAIEIPKEAKLLVISKEKVKKIENHPQDENKAKTVEDYSKIENDEGNVPQILKKEGTEISKQDEHNLDNSNNKIKEKRFIDIDEFQARQKLIEEQNKRRKELLATALADRTKRTQEEAQRLNEIQNEFKKLDAVLSNDVKILRKQIEIASVDYLEAQKRYLRIEKEFLDAKIALQNKLEKKELLTEHLCAIIEQNEERKATKLTELLNKLDLGSHEDKIVD